MRVRNWDACQFGMFTAPRLGPQPAQRPRPSGSGNASTTSSKSIPQKFGAAALHRLRQLHAELPGGPRRAPGAEIDCRPVSDEIAGVTAPGETRKSTHIPGAVSSRLGRRHVIQPIHEFQHLPARLDGSPPGAAADGRREVGAHPLPRRRRGRGTSPSASASSACFRPSARASRPSTSAPVPNWTDFIEFCFRRTGRVTEALWNVEEGDTVGFRGPYGNGYPMEKWKGKNLIFVGGGIAMPPIRCAIWYALENRDDFGQITIVYGARTVGDLVFAQRVGPLGRVRRRAGGALRRSGRRNARLEGRDRLRAHRGRAGRAFRPTRPWPWWSARRS